MKKILFFLAVALTVGFYAQAQNPQHGERMREMMKQRLKDSLQLSDAQSDSVAVILQEFQPQQRDIMRDQGLSREDKMAKLGELRTARKAKLKAVLSDEQIEKYEAMEERMREQMRQGGGRRFNGN
ncbi:hypothetical protein [Foetidibacter luteolus]|uniref:hypothetical protein n=1 Tax=Foetidibacter luteolus TaxID=2608880 RepID=UPI00129B60E9|nr:hypothetical protein [Foetidibacter luteolus]